MSRVTTPGAPEGVTPGHPPPSAGVLITHGLNCGPAAMGAFVRLLTSAGFLALPLSFRRCRGAEARRAFHRVWLEDFAAGYDRLRALCPGVPLYHLGFSLGCLVCVRFLQQTPSARFERMVLLAPALSLRPAANLLRPLLPLAHAGVSLPSLCPAPFRARRFTPLGEYRALLRLVDEIASLEPGSSISATRTAVYMDPRDELVSYAGVQRWIARNGRPGWALRAVQRDGRVGGFRRHLLLEEGCAGPECWGALTRGVLEHFGAACPPRSSCATQEGPPGCERGIE